MGKVGQASYGIYQPASFKVTLIHTQMPRIDLQMFDFLSRPSEPLPSLQHMLICDVRMDNSTITFDGCQKPLWLHGPGLTSFLCLWYLPTLTATLRTQLPRIDLQSFGQSRPSEPLPCLE